MGISLTIPAVNLINRTDSPENGKEYQQEGVLPAGRGSFKLSGNAGRCDKF
jgi:hypothetical protein